MDELDDHVIIQLDIDAFIDTLLTGKLAPPKTAASIDRDNPNLYLRLSLERLESNFNTTKNGRYDDAKNEWIGLTTYNEEVFLPRVVKLVNEIISQTKPNESVLPS